MDHSVDSHDQPVLASPKPTCAVDALCDDVLLSIFLCFHQACLACHDKCAYDSLSTTWGSPWVLSHVCQHWRTLVVSAPRLWTAVYLNVDIYFRNPSGRPLALEIFLQRSQGLELDVELLLWSHLDFEEIPMQEGRTYAHSLIRQLLPTTARWRHLKIVSSRDGFDAFAGCSFERLRSLDVCYCWNGDEDKAVVTLFHNATELVELTLGCQEELYIDLPAWAGIHTFSTGCSGLLCLPNMLGLQDLHIKEECGSGESLRHIESEMGSFELPLLRTITVSEGTANCDIYELSKHLRAPSLTTLVLHVWDDAPPGPFRLPVFDNLDSLMNLSLHFYRFQLIDTIPFLTRASSVKNLYLGPNAATPAVMEAIGLGIVPKLQTLGLHFSAWKKYRDVVVSMIMSRAITYLTFARFGPYDKLGREDKVGWNKWLTRDLRVRKGTHMKWEVVVREKVHVQIVERYCF